MATYELREDGAAIVCGECGAISYNDNDVQERYCGSCNTFLGENDGPGELCPGSNHEMPYRGRTGASHSAICPGCGKGFRLLDVWKPAATGHDVNEGTVTFPAHVLEGGLAPRSVVHPQQPVSDMRRQRYGGVTSRRYRP